MSLTHLVLIVGSTRPVRIGDQLAAEVAALAAGLDDVAVTVEDLAVRALPLLDEPQPPAFGRPVHRHSQDWATTVTGADAVVFVTPEYNAGYPAALKNAVDYLYAEWADKPALVVGYGAHGGARVQQQLGAVASSLRMRLVPGVGLDFTLADLDSTGRLADPARTVAPHRDDLVAALRRLVDLAAAPSAPVRTLSAA